ncbi:MAG: ATP-binding protein [Streptosporangiaceae bacterium]|jgi:signal transduction histidine kinase
MAEKSAQDSERPARLPSERFAALVRADRAAILMSFQERMEASDNPLIRDPCSRSEVMAIGSEIITDIAESVLHGSVRIDDRYKLAAWTLGEAQARSHLTPADSLRAAVVYFNVAVSALIQHVRDDPELLSCLTIATLALNESATVRIREATLAYTGCLLNRIHHAHLDERRRIARELHDRLGEGLSVALRQLELHEVTSPHDPHDSEPQTMPGKEALGETMRRLRLVISDLRQDPVTSLEKALIRYLDSVATDVDVRLRVSGDDTWASPTVIDETYLIIREAIRNALKHGAPQVVLIGVDIAPHELRAWVEDNGCGFVPALDQGSVFDGTAGLASMRERAALLGGTLTISSVPGQGTHVELVIDLPKHRDEQPA